MYDAPEYLESRLFANWKEQKEKEPIEIRLFRQGLRRLAQFGARGRLLDVGCGRGLFLRLARDKGWAVVGVDVSRQAADFARETFGLQVVTGTLEEAGFPSASFDAVSLWDCLEHLEDPRSTLREIHRVLRDEGVCLVQTPNIDSLVHWLGTLLYRVSFGAFRKPIELLYDSHHNYFFSGRTLLKMLARAGMGKVLSLDRFGAHISRWQTVPIPHWMEVGTDLLDWIAKGLRWDYRTLVCASKG